MTRQSVENNVLWFDDNPTEEGVVFGVELGSPLAEEIIPHLEGGSKYTPKEGCRELGIVAAPKEGVSAEQAKNRLDALAAFYAPYLGEADADDGPTPFEGGQLTLSGDIGARSAMPPRKSGPTERRLSRAPLEGGMEDY